MAQDSREIVTKFHQSVASRARDRLIQIDPKYVADIQEFDQASKAGILHPGFSKERILNPTGRLPNNWRLLLETCHDLYRNADFFEQCAASIERLASQGEDAPAGAHASFIATSFNVWALALIEKSQASAKKALRVTLPNTVGRRATIEIEQLFEYALGVRVELIKGVRHPALHSSSTYKGRDGDLRPPSSGITDDAGTLELSIALLVPVDENYESFHEYLAGRARRTWAPDFKLQADQIRVGLQTCLERAAHLFQDG